MKRAIYSVDNSGAAAAKRRCFELQGACEAGECSSASPVPHDFAHVGSQGPLPQPQAAVVKQVWAPAAVEHVLERTLCDADAALQLTLHAMSLATQIHQCGSPAAADKALNIAEQALAATVQQLARAQALVAHKVQQQQVVLSAHEEDAELQDTCSSSYTNMTSAGAC